jgi:coenzyme F420-reducing hydrogenase gamma subunit
VCIECKRAGNVCVTVAHGTPCLGPLTHAGCGALCPSYHRGCYGCFGPAEASNPGALAAHLGMPEDEIDRMRRTFYPAGPGA